MDFEEDYQYQPISKEEHFKTIKEGYTFNEECYLEDAMNNHGYSYSNEVF